MRGMLRKRGHNYWELRFEEARIDGERRTRYASFRGTRQEAQKELTRLLADADKGKLPDAARGTIGERIAAWLAGAHNVSRKTRERYGEVAANQVLPHLGDVLLIRLKSDTVRAWHAKLLESGLSPRTILHAHRVLCSALAGTQARSALNVRTPLIEVEEIRIPSDDDVSRVLAALHDSWLLPVVVLGLDTGMRRGELLGLQWGDVDLEVGALRVERSVEETNAGLRMKAPKTKRGRRSISLPAATVDMLRGHKVRMLEQRLIMGLARSRPLPSFSPPSTAEPSGPGI